MKRLLLLLLLLPLPLLTFAQSHWVNDNNNYVYYLWGQSNANGSATLISNLKEPYIKIGNAYIWSVAGWQVLNSITRVNQPNQDNSSFACEMSLAATLTNYTHGNIYIVKYAVGGTPLCNDVSYVGHDWSPWISTSLYAYARNYISNSQTDLANSITSYTKRGLIYYQGETDAMSDTCSANYEYNLTGLINRFRADFGANLKVWLIQLHSGYTGIDYLDRVRTAQANVAATLTNIELINIDTMPLANTLHINWVSQIMLGNYIANSDTANLIKRHIVK